MSNSTNAERAPRITPQDYSRRTKDGDELTLVCAYDDDDRCAQVALSDSISRSRAEQQRGEWSKQRGLVFY